MVSAYRVSTIIVTPTSQPFLASTYGTIHGY
jgi:hypothetical protein